MNPKLKRQIRQLLPRTLKAHRIRGGSLRGYQLVTSWHDYPAAILGRTEAPLLEWFAANVAQGETWLDVGAHYGYTALALAHYTGTHGRVFSFEPMLASAGCLVQTRRLNGLAQLTVVPLGLGDSPTLQIQQLPVVRGMVDSTLGPAATTADWQETFLVGALDCLWNDLCGGNAVIHGIKIDVQGMELAVLRGMLRLLQTYHPKLVVEVHAGVGRDELLHLIERAGYTAPALPVEPAPGETTAQFRDNASYAWVD